VVHFPADATSVLPQILTRAGALRAAHAKDGEPLREGRIHVARVAGELAERFALSRDTRTAGRHAERRRDARRQAQALLSLVGPAAGKVGRRSGFEAAD
jgi:chemotaxis response regulator CheB